MMTNKGKNEYPIIYTLKFNNKKEYYQYITYIETDGKIYKDGREFGKMTNYIGWYDKYIDMYVLQVEGYIIENLIEKSVKTTYQIKIME